MNRIVKTHDGSHTIFVPELNEHYHSVHGAVQESNFIFIINGFDACKADLVEIYEVGFGTGLNALLTASKCIAENRIVNYTTIEKYPLDDKILGSLNHHHFAGVHGQELYNSIHLAPWDTRVRIDRNFTLLKIRGDFTKEPLSGQYDLIYFDAFGPDKQPEMWTQSIFAGISSITREKGIFVTYSAKGEVKRNLKINSFEVSLLPGPPGKRQIIRAIKK